MSENSISDKTVVVRGLNVLILVICRFRDYEFNQVWRVNNSRFLQQDIPVLLFANQANPAHIQINPLAAVSVFLITYFFYTVYAAIVRFYRRKQKMVLK